MSATNVERLDELLALARECGRLGNEASKAEHAHASASSGYTRTAYVRMVASRKKRDAAEAHLGRARDRFLKTEGWRDVGSLSAPTTEGDQAP